MVCESLTLISVRQPKLSMNCRRSLRRLPDTSDDQLLLITSRKCRERRMR